MRSPQEHNPRPGFRRPQGTAQWQEKTPAEWFTCDEPRKETDARAASIVFLFPNPNSAHPRFAKDFDTKRIPHGIREHSPQ